jgi:hypothetical protein
MPQTSHFPDSENRVNVGTPNGEPSPAGRVAAALGHDDSVKRANVKIYPETGKEYVKAEADGFLSSHTIFNFGWEISSVGKPGDSVNVYFRPKQ